MLESHIQKPAGRIRSWRRSTTHQAMLGLTGLGLVIVAAVVAGATGALAARDLIGARDAAVEGQNRMAKVDVEAAAAAFGRSVDRFEAGRSRLREPMLAAVSALPIVGDNVDAASSVASAGMFTARAGRRIAGALAELPGGVAGLAPRDGRIPVEGIARLHGPVSAAADDLRQAHAIMAASDHIALLPPVAEAVDELAAQLPPLLETVETAAALSEHLPAFLGGDQPRRYFFSATNPAELRGAGGLPGAYAIMTAEGGQLSFTDFHPVQDLENVPVEDIEAPSPDYASRYNRYGGGGFWLNINMTPDFPSAASAMEALYEHVTGETVDGVIAADPHALAALVGTAGSVDLPGAGRVDANDVVGVIANEAFGEFDDSAQRKHALGGAAASVFHRFLDGGAGDLQAAAGSLASAAAGGHLLVYSSEAAVQDAFERAGVAGGIADPDGDYLAVVGNNAAANKVDFYTYRTVRYDAELLADGGVDGRAIVTLTNKAPKTGQPRYVIGPNFVEGIEAGENSTILGVYCAPGCQPDGFARDGVEELVGVEREFGRPVITSNERLKSGQSAELAYTWTVPGAWQGGNSGTYQLTFDDQPQINPTDLQIRITVPDNAKVVDASEGFQQRGRTLFWTGQPSAREVFEVRLAEVGMPSLVERLRRPLLLN